MNSLILWAALVCSAEPLEDGTLLFLENASSVVKAATGGKIGHVAIIVCDDGRPWIYEATPARVRRVDPRAYDEELARINAKRKDDDKIRVLALCPSKAYSAAEKSAMCAFLSDQLGRRYSLLNYVQDKEGDGIHCAELAASALNATGRYNFPEPHSIHPSRFYELVQPTYRAPQTVTLPKAAPAETWCQRADRRWGEIWRWTCWGCSEAWSLCY
jgi:hypothetical protein